jgi:hypothetical protein
MTKQEIMDYLHVDGYAPEHKAEMTKDIEETLEAGWAGLENGRVCQTQGTAAVIKSNDTSAAVVEMGKSNGVRNGMLVNAEYKVLKTVELNDEQKEKYTQMAIMMKWKTRRGC